MPDSTERHGEESTLDSYLRHSGQNNQFTMCWVGWPQFSECHHERDKTWCDSGGLRTVVPTQNACEWILDLTRLRGLKLAKHAEGHIVQPPWSSPVNVRGLGCGEVGLERNFAQSLTSSWGWKCLGACRLLGQWLHHWQWIHYWPHHHRYHKVPLIAPNPGVMVGSKHSGRCRSPTRQSVLSQMGR